MNVNQWAKKKGQSEGYREGYKEEGGRWAGERLEGTLLMSVASTS